MLKGVKFMDVDEITDRGTYYEAPEFVPIGYVAVLSDLQDQLGVKLKFPEFLRKIFVAFGLIKPRKLIVKAKGKVYEVRPEERFIKKVTAKGEVRSILRRRIKKAPGPVATVVETSTKIEPSPEEIRAKMKERLSTIRPRVPGERRGEPRKYVTRRVPGEPAPEPTRIVKAVGKRARVTPMAPRRGP